MVSEYVITDLGIFSNCFYFVLKPHKYKWLVNNFSTMSIVITNKRIIIEELHFAFFQILLKNQKGQRTGLEILTSLKKCGVNLTISTAVVGEF